MSKSYPIIAEFVDVFTGDRHFPSDAEPFTPHDEDQAKRLIAAGCLDADGGAPPAPAPTPAPTPVAPPPPPSPTPTPTPPPAKKPKPAKRG